MITRAEICTHVFNALADYRDHLTDDERHRLGGFFVGRASDGVTLIFGGPPTPTFAISVSLAQENVDPE